MGEVVDEQAEVRSGSRDRRLKKDRFRSLPQKQAVGPCRLDCVTNLRRLLWNGDL